MLDEGTRSERGRGVSVGRRMGCSRGKGSAGFGPRVLVEIHRERNLLEATETGFLSSFFES